MSPLRPAARVLGTIALGLTLLSPALAAPQATSSAGDDALAPLRQGGGETIIYRDQATGVPTFVGGNLPAVRANVTTPQAAAQAFFAENRDMFGMANPGAELSLVRDERDGLGMNHVRFQQRYNGVEVFGGVLIAHTRGIRIASITGNYFPGLSLETQPALTIEQAADRARAAAGAPDATVASERSGLAIYAKGERPALTWKVELIEGAGAGRWLVFVDARSGRIVHGINMAETARNRTTYTMGNNPNATLPGTKLCEEANPAGCAGDPAAKAAHDNAGIVYDYYKNIFGRDSIDGQGMALISSVHYGSNYNNAFWNGSQMVYGDGDGDMFSSLSQSLDVVAHELTHGITQHTADLVYEDESGALNESYSDVMGVLADTYGRSVTQPNWQLGEDVWTPSIAGDALRDMADPHKGNDFYTYQYNCSYRPGQPYYCGQPASVSEYAQFPINYGNEVPSDSGGVHTNSGIPNKAAYLIIQGGSFGGVNVAGIGVAKTQQIYYRTLTHYLTPYATFLDARNASIQACADLTGQFGITANNCASVRNGFKAVGVDAAPELANKLFAPLANFGVANTTAIGGKVTLNGGPAAGITLQLRRCDVRAASCGSASIVATATTDSAGTYRFAAGANIPNTDDYTWYRVVYFTPSENPDGKLLMWVSDDIGTYVKGNVVLLDAFDIADVSFGAPNDATPRSFPVTFTWAPRAVGGDYYIWEGYDNQFNLIALENPYLLHTQASFKLNSASDKQLYPGSSLTGLTFWDAALGSKAGFGYPWNSGRVALAGAQALSAEAFATRRAQLAQRVDQLHPRLGLAQGQ
jgi:Zn-dependent metalloprotease